MGRNHHHHNDTSNIKVAFFLNLGFTIIEIIGGLLTNSLAILSDAAHDLGDSIALGLAWYFQKISNKRRTNKYTYGYKRFSLLGAIINSIILIVGSIFIIQGAIPRLIEPQEIFSEGVIALAILGVIVNGAAVIRLRKGSSLNEKVVSLHLLEDVLGWVAVLIGSIVIYFTGWYVIDAYLSLGIALFILINVFRNLKSAFNIILQAVPESSNIPEIELILKSIESVLDIHDLHLWTMDGENNILTVHLVVDDNTSDKQRALIKQEARKRLKSQNIHHSTIEIEGNQEDCEHIELHE
ncbi:MAG: cation transporter [Flavobacteriales bacterium]|nr:cation transporter [Flavobacteriales bacterium]